MARNLHFGGEEDCGRNVNRRDTTGMFLVHVFITAGPSGRRGRNENEAAWHGRLYDQRAQLPENARTSGGKKWQVVPEQDESNLESGIMIKQLRI